MIKLLKGFATEILGHDQSEKKTKKDRIEQLSQDPNQ